jgi:hypothetical protein
VFAKQRPLLLSVACNIFMNNAFYLHRQAPTQP